MVGPLRDPHSYGNERSRAMRSIRSRFRRLGKVLWIRPASPAERRMQNARRATRPSHVARQASPSRPTATAEAAALRQSA